MREVKYLSPTSIKLWHTEPERFYTQYISDNKPPREPQTSAMAAGSAFDAYVKSHLYGLLIGDGNEEYELNKLMSTQVEPQNIEWAYVAGLDLFNRYQECGALSDLLLELEHGAHGTIRFESTVMGTLCVPDGCVPLLGKPDLWFDTPFGTVIYDWKVNGYCATKAPSPKKYYLRSYNSEKGYLGIHKGTSPLRLYTRDDPDDPGPTMTVSEQPLDTVFEDWAAQTAIYQWVISGGSNIGGKFIVGIDQLLGNDGRVSGTCNTGRDGARVCCYRGYVSPEFQQELMQKTLRVWQSCQVGLSDILDDDIRESLDRIQHDSRSWAEDSQSLDSIRQAQQS